MKIISIVFIILCFVVALTLGSQNQEIVNFNYLVAQGNFKLSWLLGMVFGIGFMLGWLICGMLYLKERMSRMMLKKQVNKQRQELDNLRTDPLKE